MGIRGLLACRRFGFLAVDLFLLWAQLRPVLLVRVVLALAAQVPLVVLQGLEGALPSSMDTRRTPWNLLD